MQENCIRDPQNIDLVSVCFGSDLLPPDSLSRGCPAAGAPPGRRMSNAECMRADAEELRRDFILGKKLLSFRKRLGLLPFM